MPAFNPPFRADHVGSLLRPLPVLDARSKYAAQHIDATEKRAIEDAAIAEAIRGQEAVGLQSITDGEFRREWFHLDFLQELAGVTVSGAIAASSDSATSVGFTPPRLEVTGKLAHQHNIQVDDYKFVAGHTSGTPKVCIPSPTMVHFRGGRAAIDINSYPDMDVFFADLAASYRAEIDALYTAGCRYIQLDDTNLAYLCDPKMRAGAVERGDDPNELPRTYASLINAVISSRPADLTAGIHLCRGNFGELDVDTYFLEYDDERSGDFKPLRFVPPHKTVVLGIVSSKHAKLEPQEDLRARIDEAAKYVSIDQLCLSPQCGFSSTMHGNVITPAEQWAKLQLVVDTAAAHWH
jgi:5-methyltetrahydropteroyltriglutamate--homocysteine methyltransferase